MRDAAISFPIFGEGFILNPSAFFTIFGANIYFYGLIVALGYGLAGLYIYKRRELFSLSKDNILDILLIAIICGILGARLYYIIFNFDRYFGTGNIGDIFRLRDGGLAVYGGVIASGIGFLVYSKIKKIKIGNLLDAAGFGLFIGQAIGRWGNFFNREAFGVETAIPVRMGLTFERSVTIDGITYAAGQTAYFHPTFLYEMLWNVLGFILIHIFSKLRKSKYPGQYFLFYVAWYGFGRFFIESLRIDSLFIAGTSIRASQALAGISCLVAVGIMIYKYVSEKRSVSITTKKGEAAMVIDTSLGQDAEDLEDSISMQELAEIDNATPDEVNNEDDEEEDN